MKDERRESLIIEASPGGISAVTVRVSRGQRDRGIALLNRSMAGIAALDRALRATDEPIAANSQNFDS